MKAEIEKALRPLIGEPLSDMHRFAGIQIFEFGVQRPCKNRKGQDIARADQSIQVSCDWCITGPTGVVVSSNDFGTEGKRWDESAYPFYEMIGYAPPVVENIEVEEDGKIRFVLAGKYSLDILPEYTPDTKPDEDIDPEQWRYLLKDKKARHFVVNSDGIDEYSLSGSQAA